MSHMLYRRVLYFITCVKCLETTAQLNGQPQISSRHRIQVLQLQATALMTELVYAMLLHNTFPLKPFHLINFNKL